MSIWMHAIIYATPQSSGIYFHCGLPLFINTQKWLTQKLQVLLIYPYWKYLFIGHKDIPRRLTWCRCKIWLNFLLIWIFTNDVWHPNLSSREQGLESRLVSWVSCMGICAHGAAVCNHITGWFSWKKSLAWKSKRVKFQNAFQPQKIRANTFREWQARSCQNASQRGRMQERPEHSRPPDVNLDQIQITAMPAARFSWVPGKSNSVWNEVAI